jgi:hypothetical protein
MELNDMKERSTSQAATTERDGTSITPSQGDVVTMATEFPGRDVMERTGSVERAKLRRPSVNWNPNCPTYGN